MICHFHTSVVSIAHEQNIICSKTLICRQLFAGHVVGFQPMKKKEKNISKDNNNYYAVKIIESGANQGETYVPCWHLIISESKVTRRTAVVDCHFNNLNEVILTV